MMSQSDSNFILIIIASEVISIFRQYTCIRRQYAHPCTSIYLKNAKKLEALSTKGFELFKFMIPSGLEPPTAFSIFSELT